MKGGDERGEGEEEGDGKREEGLLKGKKRKTGESTTKEKI